MSFRELVILLLGFAIVAVILRGLFVALRARRGQTRLAIDKNIPTDVDLDALELAELPGGGARVVSRRGAGSSKGSASVVDDTPDPIEQANSRAENMALGRGADVVPVLMDSITVAGAEREAVAENAEFEDSPEDLDADADMIPGISPGSLDEITEQDPAEVLLDYRANAHDGLASVQPDYPEEEAEQTDSASEQAGKGQSAAVYDDAIDDNADDTGDFSMTAGERIGYQPRLDQDTHSYLFDSDNGDNEESQQPLGERESLFSTLRNKLTETVTPAAGEEESETDSREPELHSPAHDPVPQQDAGLTVETDSEAAAIQRTATSADIRQQPAENHPTEIRQQASLTQPSEVIVLNVMAREGQEFHGDELLHAAITSGLKFGDMNIFHQRYGNDSKGPVIFSLANILNPGTFDLNSMSEFSTIGVSLFLAMPTTVNNSDAFEYMLEIAQQLCESLGGELKDDHRNLMTAQTIEHYRQRIRDFELRKLKAAASHG